MNNKLIAIDTNIFIYFLEKNPQFGPQTKLLFDQLSANKMHAITSIISLIELLSVEISEDRVSMLKNRFLQLSNLQIFDVNQTVALDAARIRRKYHFRMSDSIQLATAEYAKVDMFITNDQRLKRFKEVKLMFLDKKSSFE